VGVRADEGGEEPEDDERRRRAVLWFALVFLVVVFLIGGAVAFGIVSFGGTGELTVNVADQNGNAASGQEVQILDPDTGEVIATGTTDEDGEVEFELEQGDYEIVVGDKTQDVTLDDETTVDFTVNTSPPEPSETIPGDRTDLPQCSLHLPGRDAPMTDLHPLEGTLCLSVDDRFDGAV